MSKILRIDEHGDDAGFRFGDSTPTPRSAYKLTVVTPGEPERVVTVLGHLPLSAALFHVSAHEGGFVKIEPVPA